MHAGMDIDSPEEWTDGSIQDALLEFQNKRVRVTIEEL